MPGFNDCLAIELVFEGGKIDHPKDPGGRTNQGVTQRVFSAYLSKAGKNIRDVYTMTVAERDEIYRIQYWNKIRGDELPPGIDLVIFDGAINSGVAQSVKWAQRALGLTADGVMGMITAEAIKNTEDHDGLVASILDRRMAFLKALKTWPTFGKGWSSRLRQVKTKAQAWAIGNVGPQVVSTTDGGRKALLSQAKKPPPRAPADALASGGAVTSGLSTVQSTLQPLQGTPQVDRMLMIIAVVAAIATACGLAYGVYARRKKAELEDALDLTPEREEPAPSDVP